VQEHCLVISLLPGRGESARDFMRQLAAERRAEQERSERRVGIRDARWFLARAAAGEMLIGLLVSPDLRRSLRLLAVSMDPHDLWFKRRFAELSGLDLNEAPNLDVAEQLVGWRHGPPGEAQDAVRGVPALQPSEMAAG
jgi:hypothetical protein